MRHIGRHILMPSNRYLAGADVCRRLLVPMDRRPPLQIQKPITFQLMVISINRHQINQNTNIKQTTPNAPLY